MKSTKDATDQEMRDYFDNQNVRKILNILVSRYADGFHICGVTDDHEVAMAWNEASSETEVYTVKLNQIQNWTEGIKPWGDSLPKEEAL